MLRFSVSFHGEYINVVTRLKRVLCPSFQLYKKNSQCAPCQACWLWVTSVNVGEHGCAGIEWARLADYYWRSAVARRVWESKELGKHTSFWGACIGLPYVFHVSSLELVTSHALSCERLPARRTHHARHTLLAGMTSFMQLVGGID